MMFLVPIGGYNMFYIFLGFFLFGILLGFCVDGEEK